MISTNSATAIRRLSNGLTERPANRQQASNDAPGRWATSLDIGDVTATGGLQLAVVENVNRLVYPTIQHARHQLGDQNSRAFNNALDATKQAFFESLSSVQVAQRDLLIGFSNEDHGQFAAMEDVIGRRWGFIPISALDHIGPLIDDTRALVEQLGSTGQIPNLATAPLLDALDWANRSVRSSRQLAVLVGLGPTLATVRHEAEKTLAATPPPTDGNSREVWNKAVLGLGVLAAAATIAGTAGLATPLLSLPAVAQGAAAWFELTENHGHLTDSVGNLVSKFTGRGEDTHVAMLEPSESPAALNPAPGDRNENEDSVPS